MKELQAIENYVVYLIRECGLLVTIHPIETETLITFSSLMHFNTHANPYCTHVKSTKEGYERCLLQQRKVLGRLKQQDLPLCGLCHAGVLEYVYPLKNDRGVIGFISVSGYATKEGASRIPQTAKEFGYAEPVLQKAYGTLCGTVPDRERVDTLIAPLCLMLELAYRKERGEEKKENVLTRILRYIQMNYSVDLTEEELCRLFGCSRSYFSHTFRRETGKSFREYLTDVRLENAKRLLAFSHLNVTEISFAIGYTDSNYFSNVFKKKEGVSPRTYRKSLRHEP
ncbi:MAG: helix-turn-helix domain-containing protein [Clostridia bacterium]|nr:helix-turn-helix domain-containing protein [Clostridia bacterium]